ncbi:MAG: TolC family protein [Tepidibacter sp.]|jgi:outer membrane protein TolC|uniref:TolC family protein n=1 Tax=Tepidibacter sp. TaxID=2529387 RepID=UPI0025D2D502|nr:TolC family protein [Tepidibacter sp.]MCT4509849.1 TolC family protein [Tepidibacter sp.]MCT4585887.1 TolC family protein [Peptostreptococcaceae bacterium]
MKKNRYIFLFVMIALFTLFNSILTFKSFASDLNVNTLTLEKAQSEAVLNSNILKEDKRSLDALYDDRSKTRRQEKRIKNSKSGGGLSLEEYKYESGDKMKEVDIKIKGNELKLKEDTKEIKRKVLKSFQDILIKQKELEISKMNMEHESKKLEISKLKNKLGKISDIDLENSHNKYDEIFTTLSTKKIELENLYNSLNQLMGHNMDERYTVVLDDINKDIDIKNIKKPVDIMDMVLKNRYDYVSLKNSYEIQNLNLNNIKIKYPSNTYMYKEEERTLNNYEESYKEKEISIKNELENEYSQLILAKEKLNDNEQILKNSKTILQNKYNFFKYGRLSKMDIEDAKVDMMNKELDYMSNKFEFQRNLDEYTSNYDYIQ